MIKSTLKPLVLSAAVAAALVVLAAPAYALEAKLSGQVNRGIMHADDGVNSELLFVDIDNSSTRLRFTGSEDLGSGLKAGIVWEVEYQSNDSDKVTLLSKSAGGTQFGERKAEVYFQGAFGQVTLGQGDGAMNGGSEVDLSGTSVISYAGGSDIGGAILFTSGGVSVAGTSLRSVVNQQDFESRYDRLRYDSPLLGPVKIAVSTGTSGGLDVNEYGVWFNVALGGGNKLAGAFGISTKDLDTVTPGSGGDQDTTGGSISWLSPMGWNVTFSTTNVENEKAIKRDSDSTYFKLGYKTGPHAFSVDFHSVDDQAAVGDEAESKGFAYVYTASKAVEIYGGFKTVSLDRPLVSFEDIDILTVGSRIKF